MNFLRGIVWWNAVFFFVSCLSSLARGETPFTIWGADSLDKIFRDTKPPAARAERLRIFCARNEYESAQIGVRATEDLADVTVEVSELQGPGGTRLAASSVEWHFVGFIPLTQNTPDTVGSELIRRAPFSVPDPLMEERRIGLRAGESLPIWLTLRVSAEAVPGTYRGEVGVATPRGRQTLPLEVRVFSFGLPDERHLLVTQWFNFDGVAQTHGIEGRPEAYWALLEAYARNMAEHRQNVFNVPWRLVRTTRGVDGKLAFDYADFDRYVETFERAGVKDRIEILHVGHGESGWGTPIALSTVHAHEARTGQGVVLSAQEGLGPLLAGLQEHLEERGWLAKSMIHVADEPSPRNGASWLQASRFVAAAAPKLRRIDAVESTGFEEGLEVLVPKLNYLHRTVDEFKRAQSEGRELWYYICCHPTGFYPNRFLDFSLTKVRLLHWINWRFGLTGYLHWGLTYWGKEPFGTPSDTLPPGDTHVLYPGRSGPLSSIRWETERDSLEDYEYLWLLTERMKEVQKRLGPAAAKFDPARRADERARELVRDFDRFTHEATVVHQVRMELAQEIESALEAPLVMVETKPWSGALLVPGPMSVEVMGVVGKGETVQVNGEAVVAAADGSFVQTVSISKGHATVIIQVEGEKKKTLTRTFRVREE